ncbi:M20/M25/M40 family metallo-hydrolase [Paenibacillus sonchi]|uniref:M20/M25/M40 family metallo-hydrolase n=1 Tax=Paenibacillus sonchi TaxID=373687 RepID=UPI001E42E045|nr:M20/M25/M40 family metallo-hydrolase [Paenibacillus sonchi]
MELTEMKDVFDYLEQHFEEDLKSTQEFMRLKSISATGEGIRETAQVVKAMIEEVGGVSEIIETPGHPIVYGKLDEGAQYTLLIYSMYDVLPAEEPDWISDPWAAEIHDFQDYGKCIIGRGAVNTKGPTAAFFNTIKAYKKIKGKLPVNLVFLIEGEEELSSKSLQQFLVDNKDKFAECDAMFFPSFGEENRVASIFMGVKGIVSFELKAKGGSWGGPKERGIHGAFAAWVGNPAWRLVKALSTMVGEDEKEILVEGFYDGILPLAKEGEDALDASADLLDEEQWKKAYAIDRFKWDLEGLDLWKKMLTVPTLNIDGIKGGYIGEGSKTLLPHETTVKMDIRLVPGMDPEKMLGKIRNHLDKHGYSDIEITEYGKAYYPSSVPYYSTSVQTLKRMYELMGARPQIWPWNPGSAPYFLFGKILGLPYVTGGMGHGSRQHSSNEYCTVKGVLDFEKSMVYYLNLFPQVAEEMSNRE